MVFRPLNAQAVSRFNSIESAKLLDRYESYVDAKIVEDRSRLPHATFAPSQLRCNRRSWFRIRGVTPDTMPKPDRGLQFTADIGTAIHRIVQTNMQSMLRDDWISVDDYMKSLNPEYDYTCTPSEDSLEVFLDIVDPPVRCAVDGVIRLSDTYYLFEIKTCDFSIWQDLTSAKQEHIDQVYAYCTLLNIKHVIMMYVDRQYGNIKLYELTIPDYILEETNQRFEYVLDMVKKNLAPEGLPVGDKWCSPNYCPYFKKCKEYGK